VLSRRYLALSRRHLVLSRQDRVLSIRVASKRKHDGIDCIAPEPRLTPQLFSSSYDCSLRHLDFSTLISSELFAFTDEDMLVTHFDLVPSGQEAWIADKNGGISHCDFREGKGSRRRWVVQEEGRAAKLGGMSVNRAYCN
jgi:hypothetical protein